MSGVEPGSAPKTASDKSARWDYVLVAALAFLVYAGSLKNDFVYDDLVDIREVDTVFTPGAWPEMFYTASARLFRPFKYLSYHLDNVIWGWKPMGWHLANLFWHVLTCCLLLAFLRRVGRGKLAKDPVKAVENWSSKHAEAIAQFRSMVRRAQNAIPVAAPMLAQIASQARNLLLR